MPGRHPAMLQRRAFLLGSVVALAGACSVPASAPVGTVQGAPESLAAMTVDRFLAVGPFFIAHRGSGDNWPEHTMAAYAGAVDAGATAIEVSVRATSDGVLVCHHDASLRRTTGDDRLVADVSWTELQQVRVDARTWLGPNTELQPIPLVKDVLDRFAATRVIFIEDKTGDHTADLLDLLDGYPDPRQHFVWKQWAGASSARRSAAARGYTTWGYFTQELFDRLDTTGNDFDLLGVHHACTDEQIAAVVALGKPVICWEVHFRSMRDRLLRLGVVGLMASNYPYVASDTPSATEDSFATGMRAAGDLPWTVDKGWQVQPAFDPLTRSVALSRAGLQSYHLGSMTPITDDSYTLHWEMRWPDELPASGQHAGVAFGQPDDSDYRPLISSAVGGYHVVLRRGGALELYRRGAGERSGTLLGAVATLPPQVGEWTSLQLTVTPTSIRCVRQGRLPWTVESADATYRGGYFSLVRNYVEPVPVEFRSITVQALS